MSLLYELWYHRSSGKQSDLFNCIWNLTPVKNCKAMIRGFAIQYLIPSEIYIEGLELCNFGKPIELKYNPN